ncbi:MAG: hypothetical protein HYW26_04845 [Candidatus Aenigmarchaeota archaeon]|nr:hypothetical protein [Candidatus Aenigmarchaeota archaeon]
MVWLIDFILGRTFVYRIRRRYDKARERADRIRNRMDRLAILRILDQAEPQLVILEEQSLSRNDRKRIFAYVKSGIIKAERMLQQLKERKKLQA